MNDVDKFEKHLMAKQFMEFSFYIFFGNPFRVGANFFILSFLLHQNLHGGFIRRVNRKKNGVSLLCSQLFVEIQSSSATRKVP
jgi:hypothetical protein